MNKYYQVIGALLLMMAMVGIPSQAWSEESDAEVTRWTRHSTAIDLHWGAGTPQGFVGVSVTETLDRHFAVSASTGWGYSGPHVSLMPRFQILGDELALGVGASVTGATYNDLTYNVLFDSRYQPDLVADFVLWGNMEIYMLSQDKKSGFRYGGYIGLTTPVYAVNSRFIERYEKTVSSAEPSDLISNAFVPYLGFHIGYGF